jgi:DNA mismatch repair protein MutL
MSKIRILPDALANKIAAGEVVERPASVIKELLENSLDAGAVRITVEVEAGGKRLLRVEDDGEGMTPDDALLAFERHATSKLHRADDLMEIATLGFRGEALPSIASVSRVQLETRHESSPVGALVEIHGAKMITVKEVARVRGTSLTIRDLFYNIPARKKFLKSDSTELSHIVNAVTHYALAHPEISFLLKSGGSELFHYQAVPEPKDRVFQVFGAELLKNMVPVDARLPIFLQDEDEQGETRTEQSWLRVHGFVSNPSVQKLNRNSMSFFVNRRLVRDRILLHAISEAFRNILPGDVYPVVLIFLEMPYREVDVNVHPSKTEVRFRRQALMHDFLRDTVRKTLLEARAQSPFPAASRRNLPRDQDSGLEIQEVSLDLGAIPRSSPATGSEAGQATDRGLPPRENGPWSLQPSMVSPTSGRLPFHFDESLHITGQEAGPSAAAATGPDGIPTEEILPGPGPAGEAPDRIIPLGQIDNSFIVAADQGALLIIDQHVAHERILFEKVLDQRARGRVESQRLLLPIIVELNLRQQVILESITPELAACGFEVEPFGKKTIAIKAAPADLAAGDVQKLLEELLEGLEKEVQAVNLTGLRENIAASIACHAAIKVNTRLDQQKMSWLLDNLMKTRYPSTCPHGRPIILRYEKNAILRAFKRI